LNELSTNKNSKKKKNYDWNCWYFK
jgi:hypothetical protein